MLIFCGVNTYPRTESQMFASIVPLNALAVGLEIVTFNAITLPLVGDALSETLLMYTSAAAPTLKGTPFLESVALRYTCCLLYTSDAADDLLCVDLAGRRIIKKKIEDEIAHLRSHALRGLSRHGQSLAQR